VGGGLLDQDEQPKPVDLKSDPSSVTNVVSQSLGRASDQFADLMANPFGGLQRSLRATADLVSNPVQAYEQQVLQAMAGQSRDPYSSLRTTQQRMNEADLMFQDAQRLVQLPTGGFMNAAQMRLM
jgi:hypothetical protein